MDNIIQSVEVIAISRDKVQEASDNLQKAADFISSVNELSYVALEMRDTASLSRLFGVLLVLSDLMQDLELYNLAACFRDAVEKARVQ